MIESSWALALAVLVIAFLYASVGHAGASGYIAVMSLFGMTPAAIKPIALGLNILVASIGTWQFRRAGHFSWTLFWPFALLSVPCAFFGGRWNLPVPLFKSLVGSVLLFSAWRLIVHPPRDRDPDAPARGVALGVGAGLGLIAGLTGTGGGIFLTPILLFRGWARTKTAAAVSAMFILVNSLAGLAGSWSAATTLPAAGWPLAVAACAGGAAGSYLGSRRLPPSIIKRVLAVVLTIAGGKLLVGR